MVTLVEALQRIDFDLEGAEGSLAIEKYLHPFSGQTVVELLRSLFDEGISLRLRAKGTIMSPFIKPEDLLVLSPLGTRKPGLGDVVILVEPKMQRLLIRRVIKRRKNSYLLKGDSAQEATGNMPEADILGLVTKVERRGRIIRFGLGPERIIIAFLSQKGLLRWFYHSLERLFSSLSKRGDKSLNPD